HHGMTNGVFMPYVLAFNRSAIEERITRAAAYLGIEGGFDGFMQAILDLRRDLNVPNTLPELINGLDMDEARKMEIAQAAVADPSTGTNPVELTVAAARELLDKAISGKL